MSVLYTLPVGRAFPTAIITHFNLNVKMAIPYGDEPFSWCTGDCCQLLEDEETGEVFNLTEIIDITQYLLEKVDTEESKVLLGGDCIQNKTSVIKWMSLWNSDIVSKLIVLYSQVKGTENFNKKTFDASKADVETIIVNIVETRLRDFTYLVGEKLTAADYFAAAMSAFSFMFLFDKAWVAKHPVFMRWFNTVKAQPLIAGMFANFSILDTALAPPQKKKEQKPKQEQPKKEAKAAKAPEPAADAEPAPEKKAKHPLEALGKSSKFVLDEWKRQYSNNDTRPVALPWFFENFDASEWSVWRVDYKYNDELTMTFMSNNLVGGFFNRLTGSVKYMFGCLVVYGENNDNGIVGAVLVRGQDYKPAFDVAPDWESYAYTKLDVTKEEDKKFIENMWAWDEPVVVDGVSKEIADGKVLK